MYDVLKGDLRNLDGRQKTLVLQSSGQTKRLTLAPDCKFLGPDGAVLQGVPPLEKLGLFSRKPCPITVDLEKGRVTRIELPALFAKSLVRSAPRPSTTKTWVGKPAPELALRLTRGQTLTSEELRGKVVLLDFWATWCGPCQKIPPILQKLHARYEGKGLFIVGTNCSLEHGDTRAVVAGFARKHRYQYPFAYGGDKLARTLGIRVIPMLVLIDRNGIVCYVQEGLTDALEATLVKQIERLL